MSDITLALMQPYFFPYIGYFQLISYVDEFVIYDDTQYRKGGWINRNRILSDKESTYISVPLLKGHVTDAINLRRINLSEIPKFEQRVTGLFHAMYRKSSHYNEICDFIYPLLKVTDTNLATYLHTIIVNICEYLDIETKVILSSQISRPVFDSASDKVISICKGRKADHYINLIGGESLYCKDYFHSNGIEINFIKSERVQYSQFDRMFTPNLSIIDVLMFNGKEDTKLFLDQYTIV